MPIYKIHVLNLFYANFILVKVYFEENNISVNAKKMATFIPNYAIEIINCITIYKINPFGSIESHQKGDFLSRD
jgi:hypothetical protein